MKSSKHLHALVWALLVTAFSTSASAQSISDACVYITDCTDGWDMACVESNCVPEGKLRVTLSWEAATDLDIALKLPTGEVISPALDGNTRAGGGVLRRDECYRPEDCEDRTGHANIEHITWDWDKAAPAGTYEVWATNFDGAAATNYKVTVRRPDRKTFEFDGSLVASEGAESTRHTFEVDGVDTTCEADADEDGLCDEWEEKGIDIDEDGTIDLDLPALGADPQHKDIFIEVDWIDGQTVFPLGGVVAAFAKAPVNNPDGKTGITLHVLRDEPIDSIEGASIEPGHAIVINDLSRIKFGAAETTSESTSCESGWYGTAEDRKSDNCEAIIKAKRLVYRYAVYSDYYRDGGESITSNACTVAADCPDNDNGMQICNEDGLCEYRADGGIAELPGDDFVVSSGTWGKLNNQENQQAVFMHEMGHTLGLRHGGTTHGNCKPNYLSIMNYSYSYTNLYAGRPLDFSRYVNGPLEEAALNEKLGIAGPSSWEQVVYYFNGIVQITDTDASQPIDWNHNDTLEDTVAEDLDFGCFDGSSYGYGANDTFEDQNDWKRVVLNFRETSGFNNSYPSEYLEGYNQELGYDMLVAGAKASDSDTDGLSNYDDNCPTEINEDQADADGDGVGDACDLCPDEPAPGYITGCIVDPEETDEPDNSMDQMDPDDRFGPDGDENADNDPDAEPRDQLKVDEGCTTASGASGGVWGLMLALLFFGRRRRRA